LPLIYTINNVNQKNRSELLNIVRNKNEDASSIARAVDLVIENGGIEYARKKMQAYGAYAIGLLKDIPESEAKDSLIGLVHYTMNREK